MKNGFVAFFNRMPWIWTIAGIALLWACLAITEGHVGLGALAGILPSASFLAIAAIAQSFAIVTGGGNADLSIPSVITVSAYVSISLISGADARVPLGLLATLGMGLLIGGFNAFLIVRLRVPAIVATLATGYIVATFVLLANDRSAVITTSPVMRFLGGGRVGGIPVIAIFIIILASIVAFVVHRSGFGRMLMAVGQNREAAKLAGISVGLITTLAFMTSGALASLDGALLGANSGGAFLELGAVYLLQSVGAVVIGGNPAFGGRMTVFGTLMGSVLLALLAVATQIVGLPPGAQDIVQGGVIIAVLSAAGAWAMFGRRAGRFHAAATTK
jgi:ribose transport system permease protein